MLNLLILFPKELYERKMSFGRRHVIEEILRRSARGQLHARLSGVGWPDYNKGGSLANNMRWLMPDCHAILWHKPLGDTRTGAEPLIQPRERGIVPAVAIYNEAWWTDSKAAKECQESGTSLVVHHHLADKGQFGTTPSIWLPHCTNEKLMKSCARNWQNRDIKCLVSGSLNSAIYPLRCRLARLIETRAIPGFVLDHPGYRLNNLARCEQQARGYAEFLGRSKIVLACSSKYRYGLAKYVEAAMAGAVVGADHAKDFEHSLWPHCLKLDSSDTDLELARKINDALADDHGLRDKAMAGQIAAANHHSLTGYVDELLKIFQSLTARS